MKLNNSDMKPLYQQLVDDLVSQIQAGVYPEGGKLPTEQMLSEKYGVSRITVRAAIKKLAADSMVVSKQGKGTFVCGTKVERNISSPSSFVQFCLDRGYEPHVSIVFAGYREPDKEDRKILSLAEREMIVCVERVLSMDNTPVIYEQFHLGQRFSFLLEEQLEDTSILGIINGKYGFVFQGLQRSIELVYASKEISKLLEVTGGYPLLCIDSHVETQNGFDRVRSIQYVVGDKFKLQVGENAMHF